MSLPIIAAAAGLGALLLAGNKESQSATNAVASTAGTATPTQAATGGAQGGAQYPSHSDVDAGVEAGATPSDIMPTTIAPDADTVRDAEAAIGVAPPQVGDSSSGPIFEGSADEPIATGVAGATGGALGGYVGQLAGATTKYVGDAFGVWGESFGAIW